mmetsp:Transcript_8046/g.19671  ORF Transcript_8046/g.19671 Transcript_8046/m.19671 type:complete len:220 (-) Transcript_8046:184-843(-)
MCPCQAAGAFPLVSLPCCFWRPLFHSSMARLGLPSFRLRGHRRECRCQLLNTLGDAFECHPEAGQLVLAQRCRPDSAPCRSEWILFETPLCVSFGHRYRSCEMTNEETMVRARSRRQPNPKSPSSHPRSSESLPSPPSPSSACQANLASSRRPARECPADHHQAAGPAGPRELGGERRRMPEKQDWRGRAAAEPWPNRQGAPGDRAGVAGVASEACCRT